MAGIKEGLTMSVCKVAVVVMLGAILLIVTGRVSYHYGYRAGDAHVQWRGVERLKEIVRRHRIYLAPLEMNGDFQTVSDCIFILLDPNEPGVDWSRSAYGQTVENCYFDSTGRSGLRISDPCDFQTARGGMWIAADLREWMLGKGRVP